MKKTTYCIELSGDDLGQLLDGLESRAEAWERTTNYLLNRKLPDDEFFVIEDCHQHEEAASIAAHYRSIIASITGQITEQDSE